MFYRISEDYKRMESAGYTELLNKEQLENPDGSLSAWPPWPGGVSVAPDAGPWRLPHFRETPRFRLEKRPRDIESFGYIWLISAAAKDAFERIDAEAFAFLKCDTVDASGGPGPERWLCSVTRVYADIIDLDRTENYIPRKMPDGSIIYYPTANAKLVLKVAEIGESHFFRILELSPKGIYCDQLAKDACKAQNLKGFMFDAIR